MSTALRGLLLLLLLLTRFVWSTGEGVVVAVVDTTLLCLGEIQSDKRKWRFLLADIFVSSFPHFSFFSFSVCRLFRCLTD